MRIVVVDGQGGGIGRAIVEKLLKRLDGHTIIAVGTNALATSAMLRAGAHAGATGENAVRFNCEGADVLMGPSGVAVADAMLGEVSPAIAGFVAKSQAKKFLLSVEPCGSKGVPGGSRTKNMDAAVEALVSAAMEYISAHPE